MYRLIVVVLVVVAVSCASSEPVALPPELPTPTALPAPTAQRPLSPAPTASPAPTPTTFPSAMLQQATRDEALKWLGYAGYSPFNVDGQTGVGPWMFGGTPEDQNAAMTCYRRELDRLVDVAAVADRFAVTDDRQLLDEEGVGARQAVANSTNRSWRSTIRVCHQSSILPTTLSPRSFRIRSFLPAVKTSLVRSTALPRSGRNANHFPRLVIRGTSARLTSIPFLRSSTW